ncbi:ankyrin repeat and protein kinase domain-containing protein 1-like isoform X2 [Schistocerca serialis cubense]|uniref:ankyrin repeat and protein kinase domain-containing protein 1-like isoform X2 n=1 Tax=Schistocerca serialis cubense TaxID=2023355 RepID=UPI00214EF708|nr:ankyrin repeat and protein kinase domain-containing protein 1-like isoform X2 [Schistocerca serialis cubense]
MSAAAEVQRTAAVDLGALLDAGDGAVVTLVAGGTRLAAHRAVLEERSPVFRAMFQHDTLEASCGEVRITDVEGPVLRQLLSYMYTLQAPQLTDTARELLTAADRYGLSALKAACEQQVAAQLEVETAAAAAVLAVRHSCPSLTAAAVHFIRAHDYKAMATQGWADAVLEYPKDIVEVSRLLGEPPAEARSLSQQERGRRLIEAAEQGAVEQLRELLAAGADVGAREEQWGSSWTALHWAAGRGHVAAASCLVGAGAEVDARTSLEQQTPLHWAAVSGHAGVVRLLVAASADLNARDRLGQTPLHLAAEEGHAGAAAELLLAGADRGARDKDGWTPLYLARERGNQELVDMLTQR